MRLYLGHGTCFLSTRGNALFRRQRDPLMNAVRTRPLSSLFRAGIPAETLYCCRRHGSSLWAVCPFVWLMCQELPSSLFLSLLRIRRRFATKQSGVQRAQFDDRCSDCSKEIRRCGEGSRFLIRDDHGRIASSSSRVRPFEKCKSLSPHISKREKAGLHSRSFFFPMDGSVLR